MKEELKKILNEAKEDFKRVTDNKILEELRLKYLGKKGMLKDVLSQLGSMTEDVRKEVGKVANEIKVEIEGFIEEASLAIDEAVENAKLEQGVDDISVSASSYPLGYYHPISLIEEKMVNIFKSMGYAIADGPELEEEFYNFDALNIPSHHPARDDHDSFYIEKGKLLRTHTSPVQIRVMEKKKPPIAIVVPGRCYRRDAVDATHNHTFYQMEGLVVDKGITFADLKGTLLLWSKMMFGEKTQIRLRPDYFPFTEPSAELGVTCPACGGKKCNVCKHTGWIEVGGCGLVDPQVFKNVGIDPDVYSGFAFGVGIERFAITAYGIKDIRVFFENDMRFLEQFTK